MGDSTDRGGPGRGTFGHGCACRYRHGRDDELAKLLATYDRAVSEQRARLATVIGSPGVGKTRLARELASSVADRALILEARCEPAGTSTNAGTVAAAGLLEVSVKWSVEADGTLVESVTAPVVPRSFPAVPRSSHAARKTT